MAGIEVAGLVLGALPFVLHSVDAYRDSLRRLSTFFKKRKYVEKLSRALLIQQRILEELIKSVALSSGCADMLGLQVLADNPMQYLNNPEIHDQMKQYLVGQRNFSILVEEVQLAGENLNQVARGISGLVPSTKGLTDDLIAIINANKKKSDVLNDLAPRIKLLFGITDIKAMIQEIDAGTEALDRYSRLILSNCKVMESQSSHTSARFANAFRQIRGLADGLCNAVQDGFRDRCHENHGVRLYLDDHINDAYKIIRQQNARDPDDPLLRFDLSFYIGNQDSDMLFYEAAVQVLNGWNTDADEHNNNLPPVNPTNTAVTFCVTAAPPPISKLQVTTIRSICTTINSSSSLTPRLSLALIGNWRLGTLLGDNIGLTTHSLVRANQAEHISLRNILRAPSTTLPIKPRMQLSLRIASSLLQLQHTQWLAQDWSKDTVFFNRLQPLSTTPQTQVVDLNRPFIARSFDISDKQQVDNHPSNPKATLLELGILLLEIWHGTTLEDRLKASSPAPNTYYNRMVRALEWRDDEEMLGFYGQAVSYCLTGLHGFAVADLGWDKAKLWASIYCNIIEPLSKLCKQI